MSSAITDISGTDLMDDIRDILNIPYPPPPPPLMMREIPARIVQQGGDSRHPTHIRYNADDPQPMSESSTTASSESSNSTDSTDSTIHPSAAVTPRWRALAELVVGSAPAASNVPILHVDVPPATPPDTPPRARNARPPPPGAPRPATRRRHFPRNRRRASAQNEGLLSFTRRNPDSPLICISTPAQPPPLPHPRFIWIPLKELSGQHFMKYREQISAHLARIQSQARSCEQLARRRLQEQLTLHIPAPDERKFLLMLFNSHLEPHEKRRYITEFSHTIIGNSTCTRCLNLTFNKKKCLHFECPGMCEDCAKEIDETCPTCNKEQKIICPICKDKKSEDELAPAPSGCGHYVCFECLGKAYQAERAINKCPLCRKSWH